jgi:hypothetical protein
MPKRGGVHEPSRDERDEPGDDKRTAENKHHDAAMIRNPVTVRHPQAEWKRTSVKIGSNGSGSRGPSAGSDGSRTN